MKGNIQLSIVDFSLVIGFLENVCTCCEMVPVWKYLRKRNKLFSDLKKKPDLNPFLTAKSSSEIIIYHASLSHSVEISGNLWLKGILLMIDAFDIECLVGKRLENSQNGPFSISCLLIYFSCYLTMHSIFSRMFGHFLALISRFFMKIIWQYWLPGV